MASTRSMGWLKTEGEQMSSKPVMSQCYFHGNSTISVIKAKRKGQHVVSIMSECLKHCVSHGLSATNDESFEENLQALDISTRCRKVKLKKRRIMPRLSLEASIDPDERISKNMHSYLCLCRKKPQHCPDPDTTTDLEVAVVQRMIAELEEREDAVVKNGTLPFIHCDDYINLRKRELLHKRWTENVYQPLHAKIVAQLHGPQHKDMLLTRSMMYEAYLEHRNRKKDVFLDEVVDTPIGYRYVQPDRLWLHARTRPLADPLSTNSRTSREEDLHLKIYDNISLNRHWLPPIYVNQRSYMSVSW